MCSYVHLTPMKLALVDQGRGFQPFSRAGVGGKGHLCDHGDTRQPQLWSGCLWLLEAAGALGVLVLTSCPSPQECQLPFIFPSLLFLALVPSLSPSRHLADFPETLPSSVSPLYASWHWSGKVLQPRCCRGGEMPSSSPGDPPCTWAYSGPSKSCREQTYSKCIYASTQTYWLGNSLYHIRTSGLESCRSHSSPSTPSGIICLYAARGCINLLAPLRSREITNTWWISFLKSW